MLFPYALLRVYNNTTLNHMDDTEHPCPNTIAFHYVY